MSLQLYIVILFSFKANESIRSLQKKFFEFSSKLHTYIIDGW